MSMIKTENGWRQLSPLYTTNARLQEAPARYRGYFPSEECKRYIWSLEIAHQEWVERRKAIWDSQMELPTAPKGRR